MANAFVQLPNDSTGKKVDCVSLSAGGQTVVRQTVTIADPTASAGYANVTAGALQVQIKNAAVPVSGQVSVTGSVAISNTVTVQGQVSVTGSVAISNTVTVTGQVSVTGSVAISNNINVSAMPTVTVNPHLVSITGTAVVVLATGTSNIGTINNVSATVLAQITNQITIDRISATVNVAGTFTIGTIDKISAPVALAASTANIGSINNISATVMVAITSGTLTLGSSLATGTNNIGTVGISSGTLAMSGMLDGISATVNVAIANDINIGAVSATVNVLVTNQLKVILTATASMIIAAGTANIGTINNISATLTVAVVGISSTAICVMSGVYDSSAGSTTTIQVGDSANNALRVNIVAGGTGGGLVSITGTATVVLASGTANFGTLNNISATVLVTGAVALGSGSQEIGYLRGISNTVMCQVTGFTAAVNISAMPSVVLGVGANNIGTINNISAAVTLANGATVNISTMPTVNVNLAAQSAGFIQNTQGGLGFNASVTAGNSPLLIGGRVKTSISTTATAHAATWAWFDKAGHQIVQMNAASLHPSATHGPKSVTLSASANTVLVASAGTACIFIDSLLVTSNLAGVTRCDIYETPSSAAPEVSAYLATGGGGYTQRFDPPWQLSAGQALSARLKPSASAQVLVVVHFHVGPA